MTELLELATILKYFQAHGTATPNELFAKHNMLLLPKLNLPSIRACIEKLKKEGYIRKNPDVSDNDQCVYTITIEGSIFQKKGGFTPTKWQQFIRFLKNDTGWGNLWKIINFFLGIGTGLLIAWFSHWLTCE